MQHIPYYLKDVEGIGYVELANRYKSTKGKGHSGHQLDALYPVTVDTLERATDDRADALIVKIELKAFSSSNDLQMNLDDIHL